METTIRENGGDALRFLIRFFRGSLNNELAMSVRGRSGEEEAQEGETDRRAPGFQPHIHLFVCGRNCIVASFFRLFVFLHDCPCLLVSCRKSQRDLLLYDRSNGVAVDRSFGGGSFLFGRSDGGKGERDPPALDRSCCCCSRFRTMQVCVIV